MISKYRVLVIDDSVETADGLESFLGDRYEVLKAYNGLNGLTQYEKGVDLVITDLILPDICGSGLVSFIKAKSPQLPIIVMTGWGENPITTARQQKADLILKKPFELDDLDKGIALLLATRGGGPWELYRRYDP